MPSLVGTTVATNYLTNGKQNTYADGSYYSNFGTRQLTALLINKSTAGSSGDLTKGSNGAAGTYIDANSLMSRLVRTIQNHAEIYYVGVPTATDFIVLVSSDTMNSSDTSSNTQSGGFGDLEADLAIAANTGFTTSGTAFTVTASLATEAGQIFVGNTKGTWA
jgi:hypothetical protein